MYLSSRCAKLCLGGAKINGYHQLQKAQNPLKYSLYHIYGCIVQFNRLFPLAIDDSVCTKYRYNVQAYIYKMR